MSVTDGREPSAAAAGAPPLSVTDYAVRAIRDEILSHPSYFGTRLDQRKLASRLGVSVIPVREALRVLETEGLVRIYPHRGAYVTTLSEDELRQIFLIREALDPIVAEAAARHISAEALTELEEILAATAVATKERDFAAVHRLNRAFHLRFYQEAGMPILVRTIASVRDRYTVYARLVIEVPEYAERSLAEHREIFEACRRGDPPKVAELMVMHMKTAADELPNWIRANEHVEE